MTKVVANITLEFDAPHDADAWDAVRRFTTISLRLGDYGCQNIKPDIKLITADGRPVMFKPKRSPVSSKDSSQ